MKQATFDNVVVGDTVYRKGYGFCTVAHKNKRRKTLTLVPENEFIRKELPTIFYTAEEFKEKRWGYINPIQEINEIE